jgi:hypothetical protein
MVRSTNITLAPAPRRRDVRKRRIVVDINPRSASRRLSERRDNDCRAAVETFLADAGDEGLTWEVKGDVKTSRWRRREQVEKAVGAFANSQLGGVLVIGAERRDRRTPGWDRVGVGPPAESEPAMPLDKFIRTGLNPVPPYRVRVWQLAEDRFAGVVWIERPGAARNNSRWNPR